MNELDPRQGFGITYPYWIMANITEEERAVLTSAVAALEEIEHQVYKRLEATRKVEADDRA